MNGKDYYKTLGVGRRASEKEIRQAFRRLARRHHPDVNPGDKGAEAKFKEVNEAYGVLSNQEKRAQYDRFGHLGEAWQRAGAGGPGRVIWETKAGPEFDLGDLNLGEIFGDLLGGPFARARRPRHPRGEDLQHEIELTLEEAHKGTTREVALEGPAACQACKGEGRVAGRTCESCRGSGQSHRRKRLEVKIPPGVAEGQRIRVAGEGGPGQQGRAGDLYLIARIRPHPLFARRGDDLYCEIPVTYAEAALGAEIEIPSLNGRVKVKVPAESSTGRTLRLAGMGMPRLKGGGRGDLYVKLKVVLPKNLTGEEKRLISELARLRREDPRAGL